MKKEDPTEPVFDESINKALSRRGFIHGVGGIGALLGLTAKAIGAEAPRDADGNIIPGFEKIKEDPNSSKGWQPVSDRKVKVGIAGYGL